MKKVFFLPYIIAVIVIGTGWYIFESRSNLFEWLGWCRGVSIILITVYNIITVIKTESSQTQKAWMSMKFHIGWGGLLIAFWLVIYAEVKGDKLIAAETAAVKEKILNRIETSENQLHVARHATTQKTIDYIAKRNDFDRIAEQEQLKFIKNNHDSTLLFARNLFNEVRHLDTLATYRTQKFAEYLDSRSESLLVDLGVKISSRMMESDQRNARLLNSLANRMKISEQATAERDSQLIKTLAAHLAKQQEQTMKTLVKFISVRDSQRSEPHERTLRVWERVDSLLSILIKGAKIHLLKDLNNNSSREP